MISVLCPTRGRQATFAASIDRLRSLAGDPIEVLAYVDDDDVLPDVGTGDLFICGPRVGYAGMHDMVNELAKAATGNWLLLWNDDATMCTTFWDRVIADHHRPAVLDPTTNHGDGLVPFPVVPRAWVDALGHFALNRHCDSWWQEIGNRIDRIDRIDVHVLHDRADLTGSNDDATYAERAYDPDFYTSATLALIDADADVIRGLL